MKQTKIEDIVDPCIICGGLPDIEWECDDLEIKCDGCILSIYRNCVQNPGTTTIGYVLEQINMWNRANDARSHIVDANKKV